MNKIIIFMFEHTRNSRLSGMFLNTSEAGFCLQWDWSIMEIQSLGDMSFIKLQKALMLNFKFKTTNLSMSISPTFCKIRYQWQEVPTMHPYRFYYFETLIQVESDTTC